MKKDLQKSPYTVFAFELHSDQPERLMQFYEGVLNVKFVKRTYPFLHYNTNVGHMALIISDAKGHGALTASEHGKATLLCLSQVKGTGSTAPYLLHPVRPLGGQFPERYADRFKDPDGNYVALAASLESVLGRIPPVRSWRGLLDSMKELGLASLERVASWFRLKLDRLIDRLEYMTNRPTFIRRDLGEYTHLVASREGFFAIDNHSYKRLMRGQFFGVTMKDEMIYCFQACGKDFDKRGRLLRITTVRNRIDKVEVIAKGLDDGCHQIDFIGDDLFLVDCYNARILQIQLGVPGYREHYPLGHLSREDARQYHMNSISGHPDGTIWVLLHNSIKRNSEVLVLDKDFAIIRRFAVDAGGAHNIVFTNDDAEYLIADSRGGQIVSAQGAVPAGDVMFLRGLSVDETSCIAGDSFFATRPFRRYVQGRVHFFDRPSWTYKGSLSLPAAPTEIRRIDGKDFSITNYLLSRAKAVKAAEQYPDRIAV